jgi:hypothetical protein
MVAQDFFEKVVRASRPDAGRDGTAWLPFNASRCHDFLRTYIFFSFHFLLHLVWCK